MNVEDIPFGSVAARARREIADAPGAHDVKRRTLARTLHFPAYAKEPWRAGEDSGARQTSDFAFQGRFSVVARLPR